MIILTVWTGTGKMACDADTIYIIDPDDTVHDALAALLAVNGTRLACYTSAEAFLDSASAHNAIRGVLLVEANLPGMGSLLFMRRLADMGVNIPIVVLASTSNRAIADQALKAGAVEVIEKPLVCDRLLELLQDMATDTSQFVMTPS